MITLLKITIFFINSIKTILKPLKLLVLIKYFLPHFFYVKKCYNNSYNISIGCCFSAQIHQLKNSLITFYKKFLEISKFL